MKFAAMINPLLVSWVVILSAVQGYASYQSFQIESKEIVWLQTYHADGNADQLFQKVSQQLKAGAWIRNVQQDGDELVADLVNFKVDYRRFGGKTFNTSTIIRTGRWDAKIRVSFKDEKYRVIVYGLHYIARQPERTAGKVTLEAHEINGTLTEWGLDNLRDSFRKSRFPSLNLLHLHLKEIFALTNTESINHDW